jgi:ribosomal protein S12 methylthiotransferase accessory factor
MTLHRNTDRSCLSALIHSPGSDSDCADDIWPWLRHLLGRRHDFGITRIASVTRLDRIGIPIVQVTRPLSLSNAVAQGKGVTWEAATVSAVMESIECWASESIDPASLTWSTACAFGEDTRALYEPWAMSEISDRWQTLPLPWLAGHDLFTGRAVPVPAALVDTDYTLPSRHPSMFPRTTTGLAAGRSVAQAVIHAGLEILERDAIAEAHRTARFFENHQISLSDARGRISDLLEKIQRANLLCGIWRAPAIHSLPVYWCHLMEPGPPRELVPLPSEGFGCSFTHEEALTRAVLEACQARATAISGAREDMTRQFYPTHGDRAHLDEWREQVSRPSRTRHEAVLAGAEPSEQIQRLEAVLDALRQAGANAAVVVHVRNEPEHAFHVVRLVCPPLRLNPRTLQ